MDCLTQLPSTTISYATIIHCQNQEIDADTILLIQVQTFFRFQHTHTHTKACVYRVSSRGSKHN